MQDEATGQVGNLIPEELMAQFQASRREGFKHENPCLVKWEYGKHGDGYWTAEHMNELMPEHMDLMDFLFPGHQILYNIDWSSNHSAMASDACTLSNMRVLWGGERKVSYFRVCYVVTDRTLISCKALI